MKTKIVEVEIRDNSELSSEIMVERLITLVYLISQEQSKEGPNLEKCSEYFLEIIDINKICEKKSKDESIVK